MPQPSMDLGIPKKEKAFEKVRKVIIFLTLLNMCKNISEN